MLVAFEGIHESTETIEQHHRKLKTPLRLLNL